MLFENGKKPINFPSYRQAFANEQTIYENTFYSFLSWSSAPHFTVHLMTIHTHRKSQALVAGNMHLKAW